MNSKQTEGNTVREFLKEYYEWDENEHEPQQPFIHSSISDLEQLITDYLNQQSHAVSGDVQEMDKWLDWFEGYISEQIMNYNNPNATLAIIATLRTKLNVNAKTPAFQSGYAAAPQKGMKEIKGISEVGELDRYINALRHNSPGESTKILQELFWKAIDAIQKQSPSHSKVANGWVSVKDKLPTDINDYFIREYDAVNGTWSRYHVHWDGEYFKLMGKRFESENIEWIDESPSDSEAGDGWGKAEQVLNFLLSESDSNRIDMVDGQFYWSEDDDGDQPMEAEDIIRLYKKSLPAQPIQKQ